MGTVFSVSFRNIESLFDEITKEDKREKIPEFRKECYAFFHEVSLHEGRVRNMLENVNDISVYKNAKPRSHQKITDRY